VVDRACGDVGWAFACVEWNLFGNVLLGGRDESLAKAEAGLET